MNSSHHQEFLALLKPVYSRLNRMTLAITKDREEAKDLTSEVVLIAYKQFTSLQEEKKFFSYLVSIAVRIHKRAKYRERNRVVYDTFGVIHIPDTQGAL